MSLQQQTFPPDGYSVVEVAYYGPAWVAFRPDRSAVLNAAVSKPWKLFPSRDAAVAAALADSERAS